MAREYGLTTEADLLAGLHAEQLAAAADSLGLTGEQMRRYPSCETILCGTRQLR
jgi:hypothetical protein